MSCDISALWLLKFWFLYTGFYCMCRILAYRLPSCGRSLLILDWTAIWTCMYEPLAFFQGFFQGIFCDANFFRCSNFSIVFGSIFFLGGGSLGRVTAPLWKKARLNHLYICNAVISVLHDIQVNSRAVVA